MSNYEREGYEAAQRRETLDDCPYTWRCKDRLERARIDAWLDGYARWFDERNLSWDGTPRKENAAATSGNAIGPTA